MRLSAYCMIVGLIVVMFTTSALATNITIFDGSARRRGGWYGKKEDNEVEPGNIRSQIWDMEAFLLDDNDLSVVGGYDMVNGFFVNDTADGWITTGDVFIDVDGQGYDYAIDFSITGTDGTYDVYEIVSDDRLIDVYYWQNKLSNPWIYDSTGQDAVFSGLLTYIDDFSNVLTLLDLPPGTARFRCHTPLHHGVRQRQPDGADTGARGSQCCSAGHGAPRFCSHEKTSKKTG